jgi:hypothetical protein
VTVLVAVVGDLHIGSTVGLCPRRVALDDGGAYEASKSQRWLWSCWQDYWEQVKALKDEGVKVVAVLNGDLCDRNKHGHYQLFTTNRATLKGAVLDTLKPQLDVADYTIVIRGTEAHTGESAELEEWFADDIGAVRDEQSGSASWWYWEATIEGHKLAMVHHPGTNSMRPWTMGGGANRAAAITTYNYYGQRWQPELVVFSHVHHNEDSLDNHPVRAIFNRAFSLRTAYDHRSGRSLQQAEVGALILALTEGEPIGVTKVQYKTLARKPWTL